VSRRTRSWPALSSRFEDGFYIATDKSGFGHSLSTGLLEKYGKTVGA
jgi:hypothetical protein